MLPNCTATFFPLLDHQTARGVEQPTNQPTPMTTTTTTAAAAAAFFSQTENRSF